MSLVYPTKRQRRKHVCNSEANQNVDLYFCDIFDSAESMLCLRVAPAIQDYKQRVSESAFANGEFTSFKFYRHSTMAAALETLGVVFREHFKIFKHPSYSYYT